mmetsp:Transcript_19362/g.56600  ORF Transcript_19362/g.56600 Transcript_19362/m.56600 type:complete len:227 (-) Transcript_19362:508-1188(-)
MTEVTVAGTVAARRRRDHPRELRTTRPLRGTLPTGGETLPLGGAGVPLRRPALHLLASRALPTKEAARVGALPHTAPGRDVPGSSLTEALLTDCRTIILRIRIIVVARRWVPRAMIARRGEGRCPCLRRSTPRARRDRESPRARRPLCPHHPSIPPSHPIVPPLLPTPVGVWVRATPSISPRPSARPTPTPSRGIRNRELYSSVASLSGRTFPSSRTSSSSIARST